MLNRSCTAIAGFVFLFSLLIPAVPLFVKSRQHVQCWNCWFLHSVTNLKVQRHIPFQKAWFSLNPLPLVYFPVDRCTGCCMSGWKILSHVRSYFFTPSGLKKTRLKQEWNQTVLTRSQRGWPCWCQTSRRLQRSFMLPPPACAKQTKVSTHTLLQVLLLFVCSAAIYR